MLGVSEPGESGVAAPVDVAFDSPSTSIKMIGPVGLRAIWNALPRRYHHCQATQVYTADVDGYALRAFYTKLRDLAPTLLVIRGMDGELCGAYLSHPWSDRPLSGYFGSGESFMFSANLIGAEPAVEELAPPTALAPPAQSRNTKLYPWNPETCES